MFGNNDSSLTGTQVNKDAWSASGNILCAPATPLLFGVELMYGYRSLEGGTDGAFARIQFSARYSFRVNN